MEYVFSVNVLCMPTSDHKEFEVASSEGSQCTKMISVSDMLGMKDMHATKSVILLVESVLLFLLSLL